MIQRKSGLLERTSLTRMASAPLAQLNGPRPQPELGWIVGGHEDDALGPGELAHHFGIEDIDGGVEKTHRHTIDVKKRDFITLNLDYEQMGVGGDTSWGARTHEEYTLPAVEYSYSFRLRPFSLEESLPQELSKQRFWQTREEGRMKD